MKEAGAHAVKLEGGERVAEQIACLSAAGIPVMAHIGFTPQSVNSLGGFRVQGRGDAAEQTIHDAIAVAEAGAFSVVMEMVPAELATQITGKLTIPTVGIGAGPNCDAPGAGLAGHGRPERRQGRQVSSSDSPTSGANYAVPQCNTQKKWPAGYSRPTSIAFRISRFRRFRLFGTDCENRSSAGGCPAGQREPAGWHPCTAVAWHAFRCAVCPSSW